MSYCLTASCLAHRERVFWQPPWRQWVHAAGVRPCEALAGEPDPTALHCRYCGAQADPDGAGRLWAFTGRGCRWEHAGQASVWAGGWEYVDENWSQQCPVSPTFHHEVTSLRCSSLHVSQVAG